MAELNLRFAFTDDHYSLIQLGGPSFPTAPVTAGAIKEYLAKKFELPVSSIVLSKQGAPEHETDQISNDTRVPRDGSTWYWYHLAEHPSNWRMKRDRSIIHIHSSITQFTEDMKYCLFGLFKPATLINPNLDPKLWDSLSDFTKDAVIDWFETDWETAYEAYYRKIADGILVDLYHVLIRRLILLTEDMLTLEENLKFLVANDAQLMQVLKTELSKVTLHLKSPYSIFKRWGGLAITESQFSATQQTLSLNFQASSYEVQKVTGMYISLKAERCQVKTYLNQLRTHRLLFAKRGFLFQVETFNFDHPLEFPKVERDLSLTIDKYKIKKTSTQVVQARVDVCCDVASSTISVDVPAPPPSPALDPPVAPTTFIEEISLIYPAAKSWKVPSEPAVPFSQGKIFFPWISSDVPSTELAPSNQLAIAIKENTIYLIKFTAGSLSEGVMKKQAVFESFEDVNPIKGAVVRLLNHWHKHGHSLNRATNYVRDVVVRAGGFYLGNE